MIPTISISRGRGNKTIKAIYAATFTSYCLLPHSVTPFLTPPSYYSSQSIASNNILPVAPSFLPPSYKNPSPSQSLLKMSTSSTPTIDIASNLMEVQNRISSCVEECENHEEGSVRLVAVSKTKPVELLMQAYDAGQRYFGENYAQELISKAESMPSDICWHFIGPLQSNKANGIVKALGVNQLSNACVETVSTIKLANKLNNAVDNLLQSENISDNDDSSGKIQLGIYIQMNTSGEESKSGVNTPQEAAELIQTIQSTCPNLQVRGLMTIGAPGDYSCFDALVECQKHVTEVVGKDDLKLELSMGMSGDFEEAIKRGATSVRVGSTIFGARDYSAKK
jgi:pyridoxal phosphate enzyme (YggS family)